MSRLGENAVMGTQVRALVFDVFGTVVDWRRTVIHEGQAFGQARGISVDWAEFADEWRIDGYLSGVGRVARGEWPWMTADAIHRRKLEELLERLGLTGLSEEEIDQFNRVWHRLNAWQDAIPGLALLRERYTVAALSNGNVALLTNMAKWARLPWDFIFGADLFQAYKPDARVYRGAAELLGHQPDELMMVAAHVGDLRGARAAGLQTAYVYRPLEYGDNVKEPETDSSAEVNATDFVDLATKLGA
jgi:2-haloacid dehalogenase